jgi:hypothetical protein
MTVADTVKDIPLINDALGGPGMRRRGLLRTKRRKNIRETKIIAEDSAANKGWKGIRLVIVRSDVQKIRTTRIGYPL